MDFSFYMPTRIVFGWGKAGSLAEELVSIGSKKVLFVTDSFMANTQQFNEIKNKVEKNVPCDVFDSVTPEPEIEVAEKAAEFARKGSYDTVVGYGGGSSLDIAKLCSVAITNAGSMINYVGNNKFQKKGVHSVMLPTTSGTGSELTVTSMVTVSGHKQWINSTLLMPELAIIDPELTLTMPKKVTAATGLDALCHNTEALFSASSNPLTDSASYTGIKLITSSIINAYNDGSDRVARQNMSLGSMLGGIALQARMVYGHSIGYTLASRLKIAHGVSCGIPLPYIIAEYAPSCSEKIQEICNSFGVKYENDPKRAGLEIAGKVIDIVRNLGLPTNLRELGIKKEEINELARECIELYYRQNSILVFDLDSMTELYERMWEGRLE